MGFVRENHLVNLFHVVKVTIPCDQGSPDAHAAGSYPHVVYRYAHTLGGKRQKNKGILSCCFFSDVNNRNPKGRDEIAQPLLVVCQAAPSYETKKELP